MLLDEIRQMQRASQSRRPGADNQDIGFKLFALDSHFSADSNKFGWRTCYRSL
jgi:hypothetical protein